MLNISSKKRVLVGISGGVDSAVSLYLLKKQGYEVIGVFFKLTDDMNSNQARQIAKQLNVKFFEYNLKDKFKKEIINYFTNSYAQGLTPNPCVLCNRKIKFKFLIDKANELKCDFVATGHYAKIKKNIFGKFLLQIPKDKKKDQTYFLWKLNQKILSKIIFPLSDYTKQQVKKIALEQKLLVYKSESQDICFIKTDKNDFLAKNLRKLKKSGDIVDKFGNKLGSHKGLCFYTIGQRKNLGGNLDFNNFYKKTDIHRPPILFVIKLDVDKNQVVVGFKQDLLFKKILIKEINWLSEKPKVGKQFFAKIRYTQELNSCKILKMDEDFLILEFSKKQKAPAVGQSVAIYNKNELIGGGIINGGQN